MLSAPRSRRALALFGSLCSFALAGACEDRIYKPPVNGGADAAGGNVGEDAAVPGTGMDFGFNPPDTSGQTQPDVGPGIDVPPLPTGPVCGDGKVDAPETCDDKNSTPGDGCSGVCTIEPLFECPTVGSPCVSLVVCGDSKLTGSEACDDGAKVDGDGCSAMCTVELGYTCPTPGMPCKKTINPRCGDGSIDVGEGCDDANILSGDGCTSNCQREVGWKCPTPGMMCSRDPYCGDKTLDPNEQCDDGNNIPADGCNGACTKEPFYECPTPGMPCVSTIVCNDSKVTGDEACDDGNNVSGDGCAMGCKQVEAGYTCPNANGTGGMCTKVAVPVCGDGMLTFGEYCDDGNMIAGDGCSAACRVDPGYTCPTVGMLCKLVGWCGDGKLSIADGEVCDDGDKDGGDGCSAMCVIEANWVCPTPGQACVSTVVCGDNRVTGAETCDDANVVGGDGCSMACTVESGWTCPALATCRPTRCGDGIKVGAEKCDDGDADDGDGCSSLCQLELPGPTESNGWVCPTVGQPCVRTTCGNGIVEGSEACDDNPINNNTGDGCSPFCRKEPICPLGGGGCSTSCGDGLLLAVDMAAGHECDDGNTNDGDGCDHLCKKEPGYNCVSVPIVRDLNFPIIYRDFKGNGQTNGHPDFQNHNGQETGIVQPALSMLDGGKPLHVAGQKNTTRNNDADAMGIDWFAKWYKDDAAYNKTILDYLLFTQLPSGAVQISDEDFFPIDNRGWGNYTLDTDHNGNLRNFHFTSELRYWFEYKGGETLEFFGDDDLWVFINKKLAVDIGGVHGQRLGAVTLHASNGTGTTCDLLNPCPGGARVVALGLEIGKVYEIVVFQAERMTQGSHYKLTLSGFTGTKSSCTSVCGDGIRTPDEACDLGTARNTGMYGTCNANCTLTPRCGDAMVQSANEQCDDGVNQATYGGTNMVCGPGCVYAPRCGDGSVNSANGEACDQGADNGKGYGFCGATCQPGPRCGDGVITNTEECDDGVNNGTPSSACMATCKKKCGNGMPDPLEQCDEGTANNTGGYGKCAMDCKLGPRCGDGIRQPANEACDDGKNDGSYGTCGAMCVLAPRCGDMIIQTQNGEQCDNGASNMSMPYGKNLCDLRCQTAPFCGDKQVDSPQEKCDDGMNTGQPGSCKMDCSDFIPLPSCGDNIIQAGEQCDLGPANGTAGAACDTRCKLKCGNGTRDPGEACDDGVNDGRYGTCKPDCTLANYCGDGVKAGPEQCDQGAANAANPYGPNKCTTNCLTGPYCGDGRIQMEFGEKCDSTPECNNMCQPVIIF